MKFKNIYYIVHNFLLEWNCEGAAKVGVVSFPLKILITAKIFQNISKKQNPRKQIIDMIISVSFCVPFVFPQEFAH